MYGKRKREKLRKVFLFFFSTSCNARVFQFLSFRTMGFSIQDFLLLHSSQKTHSDNKQQRIVKRRIGSFLKAKSNIDKFAQHKKDFPCPAREVLFSFVIRKIHIGVGTIGLRNHAILLFGTCQS